MTRCGQLLLEDEDFVHLTRTVKEWAQQACNGRIVSCLEGGYNLQTLGQTVRAHVQELAKVSSVGPRGHWILRLMLELV